ncbi:serine hydrolase domain-containing protein [Hymenobacter arcticus]
MNKILVPLATLCCLACSTTKPVASTRVAGVEQGLLTAVVAGSAPPTKYSLAERMRFFNVPGVSITVFERGKVAWRRGYGWADAAQQRPVTPETQFQAASISKSITAFAVLKLVAQGRLNLDQDANTYLKDWKIPESEFTQQEKATVRRLLGHTAGLPDDGFLGYSKSETIPSATQVLNGLGHSPKLTVVAVPGSKFAYSGGGYLVLQKVVEDVSGQPFAEFVQQQVFKPLGMAHSTFGPAPAANASLAYGRDGQACPGGWRVYPELGPAGLWTTPTDLATFSLAVQQAATGGPHAALPAPLAQAMLTPGPGSYGLGMVVRGKGPQRRFFHAGSNPGGYECLMMNYPEKGVGIVIMTNSSQGGTLRDEVVRAFTAEYGIDDSQPQRVALIALPTATLAAYTGRYQFEKMGNYYLTMSLDPDNHLVLLDPNDGKKNVFLPTGTDSFIDMNSGEKAVFTKDPSTGEVASVLYNGAYVFKKLAH